MHRLTLEIIFCLSLFVLFFYAVQFCHWDVWWMAIPVIYLFLAG